ncbi:NUDIX domain-containing protein [bacterium]|nr:NUDIX domain-containing protein [bacterium]
MNLTSLDFILVIVYFVVLILIGYLSSRKQNDEDFLIAERKLGAISTMATINASKTGSILMIFVALVYVWGFAAIWYFIGTVVGMLIFIPFALKLKENSNQRFYTLADYFKYNYGRKTALLASLIAIFLTFGFLVMNLIAGTKIFVFFTSWPFWLCSLIMISIVLIYVLIGGFKAVVRTDFIQYIIIIILLALLTFVLFNGSLIPASEWNFFKMDISLIIGFFVVGILYPFASPDLWQRVYASKDKKTFKKGTLLAAVIYAGFAFLLGLVALTIKVKFPEIDPDLALIHGFNYLLPKGILGLSVVLLFAAIMSTLDTDIFTGASIIVQDFYDWDKARTVKNMKKVIIILGLAGTLIAILIQDLVLSTYIFVSFMIVLAIVIMATWIKKSIKPITLIFGLALGTISIIGLLIYYFFLSDGVQPTIVVLGILFTIIGLIIGMLVSKKRIKLSGPAIIENEKLLLLFKIKDQHYEFPGGHVEKGESLEETAIREAQEEIACDVKLNKRLTTIKFEKDGQNFIAHIFSAQIIKGEPQANEVGHSRIIWLPIKDYQDYPLQVNVIEFCEKYLNNELDV